MKRQAVGIRLSDDAEQPEANGNKRIKLYNETSKEIDENSQGSNNEDQPPSISDIELPSEPVSFKNVDSGNYTVLNMQETEPVFDNFNKIINNCNGSYDKPVVEASANDSSIPSELHYAQFENSVISSEKNTVCDNKETEPPILKHYDLDIHNGESTDSFQSESSEAQNAKVDCKDVSGKHASESSNDVSEKHIEEPNCGVSEKAKNESNIEASNEHRYQSNYNASKRLGTVSDHEISETTKEPILETSEKYRTDINYEKPEKSTSQEQDNDLKNDLSSEEVKESIDVDNLTLSHLKVIELLGHTEEVLSVAADEEFILSSSADTTTKVWNVERQNVISTFSGHSSNVTSILLLNPNQSKKIKKMMSFTKVSRIAITGSLDCHIKLWSVVEGKELDSVYTFNGITCLGYLETECLIVVGTDGGKLELWNLLLKKAIVSERAHEDKVTDIKVIDNYIYSVSIDGCAKVWRYEDEDLSPIYCRKRKEISSDKSRFMPAQWETVAIADNIMYLGDNSDCIKVLDWNAGRLSLFRNQTKKQGICSCVVTEGKILFSSYYDSVTQTSGINVWKLPEMNYIATLVGTFNKINNLAVVLKSNKLKIIAGGDRLFICEFDFSKPPSSEGEFYVCENDMLGIEINENPVEIKKSASTIPSTRRSEENNSNNGRWCNVM